MLLISISTISGVLSAEHAPVGPTSAPAEKTIGDVIHYPQLHKVDGIKNAAFTEAVAKAQHRLATMLQRDPKMEIFIEGLYEDWTPEVYAKMKKEADDGEINMLAAAKAVFPKGLPEDFKTMTKLQAEFIAETGAARTLFYLGVVKRVRRTITPEESAAVDKLIAEAAKKYHGNVMLAMKLDPKVADAVFSRREKAAVGEIEKFFKDEKNQGKKVALVYGSAHDFEPYFEKLKKLAFRRNEAMDKFLEENSFKPRLAEDTGSSDFAFGVNPDHGPLKSFASYGGKYSNALLYYGNYRSAEREKSPELKKKIVAQEEKVLDYVEANSKVLEAWEWQHLVTPELKIRGLKSLSPKTFSDAFPLTSFQKILKEDPALQKEGEAWLKKQKLIE